MASFLEGARERAKKLAKQAEAFEANALESAVFSNLSRGVDRLGASAGALVNAASAGGDGAPSTPGGKKRTLESLSKEELLVLVKREMEASKKARATASAAAAAAAQAADESTAQLASLKRAAVSLLPAEERPTFEQLHGDMLVEALSAMPAGASLSADSPALASAEAAARAAMARAADATAEAEAARSQAEAARAEVQAARAEAHRAAAEVQALRSELAAVKAAAAAETQTCSSSASAYF
jgi:hypothetical protein